MNAIIALSIKVRTTLIAKAEVEKDILEVL